MSAFRINADESQSADIRVGHDFKCKSSKRSIIARARVSIGSPCRVVDPFDHRLDQEEMASSATTASRSGWIPLFLKAVPQRTGLILFAQTPLRMTAWISSSVMSIGIFEHFHHEGFIALIDSGELFEHLLRASLCTDRGDRRGFLLHPI